MSVIPTYPIILLPDAVRAKLVEPKAKREIQPKLHSKPKSQIQYQPPTKPDVRQIWFKYLVIALRWCRWLFTGITIFSFLTSLFTGFDLAIVVSGLLFLILGNGLITIGLYFAELLFSAQQQDRDRCDRLYWQQLEQANQDYLQHLNLRIQQQYRLDRSFFRFDSKQSQIKWQHSFERGKAKDEAQKGISEAYFHSYLKKYFFDCQLATDYFPLDNGYGYTTDFSLITNDNTWGIDIEIDEPYEGYGKTPHHCQDEDKDRNRNHYLLAKGWIVVRLSEFQVVKYPDSCCKLIARVLAKLGTEDYLNRFDSIDELPTDSTWTTTQVKSMVRRKYRELYLDRAGLFKYDERREKRNARAIARHKRDRVKPKRRKLPAEFK